MTSHFRQPLSHVDASACRRLWAAAIHRHLCDALRPVCSTAEQRRNKSESDYWIRHGSDFMAICSLAEINGERLRDMYASGMITPEMVAKAEGAGNGRRK